MSKVVISEFMDESAVDSLRARFDVVYEPGLVDRPGELLAALEHAEGLIVRNRTRVNAEMLAAAPRLRAVGRLGVGLDNIDVGACKARSVEVIPATGANALAVSEYVIGTTMLLLRSCYLESREVAAGEWPRARMSNGRETAGKTLGLVGFGGIGQLTARLARGLGMQVVAHDPMIADDAPVWRTSGVAPVPLQTLLADSDAVSLHVPLTPETRGLFDGRCIQSMKKGAVLINTARGGIVDEPALVEALRSGHLAGAALDVFENEPLPAGSALLDVPNLVLTPHIAGVTQESNERVSSLIAERVLQCLAN